MTIPVAEKPSRPRVKARYGFRHRIIVDDCPYCHDTHIHYPSFRGGDNNSRIWAACFKGTYILDFTAREGP